MKDIAIYGAGGFGREVACLIHRINKEQGKIWNLIGFFDDGLEKGMANEYGAVLGNIDDLNAVSRHLSVVMAIGSPHTVEKVVSGVHNTNVDFPNIFAPDAIFLDRDNITFGKGNIVCAGCIFSCNVTIGDFNVFNGLITVGHDARLGNYNSLMPATRISGAVNIGNTNFFGVSSVVLQQTKIGNQTVVGAGSVVIRKTKDGCTYVGNPAMMVKY